MKKLSILVTGGGGFLGSNLAKQLLNLSYRVTVFDKKIKNKLVGVKYIVGSIGDEKLVNKSMKNIDYVYHYAGIAGIADCNSSPKKAVNINILGTLNILEAAKKYKIKKIIFASSIYTLSEQGGVYRSTKQASEMLIENYYKLYNLEYIILRFGSLYGPNSNDFNFISNVIKQAKKINKIYRNGDGSEIRKYIFIDDAARASIQVMKKQYRNEYYEITGDQSISIKRLLNKIKARLNADPKIIYENNKNDDEHYYKNPNTFKLRKSKKLIFKNKIDIDTGLDIIIKNEYEI